MATLASASVASTAPRTSVRPPAGRSSTPSARGACGAGRCAASTPGARTAGRSRAISARGGRAVKPEKLSSTASTAATAAAISAAANSSSGCGLGDVSGPKRRPTGMA